MATVSGTQRQLTHTSNTYESNGGLTIGGNLNINGSGTVDGRDIAVDGVKLDGIATGANNYSLPSGTSSVRGGFKIGYSENGKNYPVEVLSEQMFVNVPWTDANTVYTHPTQTALTVDVNANSGATILSTLDIVVNTLGHVTSASSTTRTLTAANLGLGSLASLSSVNAATITDNSVGAAELNVVGNGTNTQFLRSDGDGTFTWAVPTDTNTTYGVGNGISLSGTTFSVAAGGGLTQTATGLSHTDTSSQASVNNSNGTVIQDITLDTYGHITSIGSANLDSRYNNYSLPAGTSSERGGFKIGYSVDGQNYPVEVSSEQMFVNVPWTDANTVYTHPTQTALTVDVNANSGATILSTLDIVVNTLGHVTSASSTTRTLTAANLGLGSLASLSSVNAATITDNSVGAAELNVVGNGTATQFLRSDADGTFTWAVPTDTNTTYSAGNGISLSSTTFSVAAGGGLTQTTTGLSHTDTSSQASVNNSNGTVIQDITLDTYGHITSIGSANLDSRYNNYSLPAGTSSERGGFKIGYSVDGQNYPVEVSSEQMFVTVPWTDANTTYSAGNGISLSSTTFSVAAGGGLTQTTTGLSHTDTSSQGSINNSNGTVIQDVTLDTYGHVTSIGSYNLDSRYYTETESDGRYLRNSVASSLTNVLTISEASNGNIVYDLANNGVYIPKPIGASYHTLTNVHTGAIAIKLPTTSWNNSDMVSFHVDIYDYAGDTNGESVTLYIYGYHQGALSWANVGAVISSTLPDKDYTVRFGHDGTRPIVWIGETTSVWNFPQISVRDFQAGYTANHLSYDSGWEVVPNATSFGTISKTSTGNYPYAKAIIGPIYTVASLPSASPAGQRGFVTDSSGELATSHGAVASGGGSTTIPVYSDGSSWRVG
jgi:hypothetical protein